MRMCAGMECCSLNPLCSLVGLQVGFVQSVGGGGGAYVEYCSRR